MIPSPYEQYGPSLNTRTRLLLFQWVSKARPPPCTWPICRVICVLLMQAAEPMSFRDLLERCRSPDTQAIREELAAEAEFYGSRYFDNITFAHVEGCLIDLAETGKVFVYAVEGETYNNSAKSTSATGQRNAQVQ